MTWKFKPDPDFKVPKPQSISSGSVVNTDSIWMNGYVYAPYIPMMTIPMFEDITASFTGNLKNYTNVKISGSFTFSGSWGKLDLI